MTICLKRRFIGSGIGAHNLLAAKINIKKLKPVLVKDNKNTGKKKGID
jgi:hypothetical protein